MHYRKYDLVQTLHRAKQESRSRCIHSQPQIDVGIPRDFKDSTQSRISVISRSSNILLATRCTGVARTADHAFKIVHTCTL